MASPERRIKQLIVNADDFGYTRGVNRAILAGYCSGIIRSASCMANGAALEDAVEQARSEPGLDIGCHLNLTEGGSVSAPRAIPHLVRADGKFHPLSGLIPRLACGWIPGEEIERECSAQIEKLLKAGLSPSHLDTHQHTHIHPRVAAAVAAVAQRFSIGWVRRPFDNCGPAPARGSGLRNLLARSLQFLDWRRERRCAEAGIRMPDFFTGFALTGRWTAAAFEETLSELQEGITELMCHPGYYDAELEAAPTRLKRERQTELEIFGSGAGREKARDLGIVLGGFRDARAAAPQPAGKPAPEVAASVSRM